MIIKKRLVCGKEFETYLSRIKIGKGKYCSQSCSGISKKGKPGWSKGKKLFLRAGKNHYNWKGGRKISHGYVYIFSPNHPFRNCQNYVREHRLIAEKCLGRYLTLKEKIHHINEISDDNRPENLYLFATNSKHTAYHQLKNKLKLISNLI